MKIKLPNNQVFLFLTVVILITVPLLTKCSSTPKTFEPGEVTFREDFNGFEAGDLLISSDLWRFLHGAEGVSAIVQESGIEEVGNMLVVDTLDPADRDKYYYFETTTGMPENFKLEIRFRAARLGGWPSIMISGTGTLDGGGPIIYYLNQVESKQIMFSYPFWNDYRFVANRNLGDGRWHTITMTCMNGEYVLYADGNKIGTLNPYRIDRGIIQSGGSIQLRIQSMVANFDYIEVTEYISK